MTSQIVDCPHCGNDVSHEVLEIHGWKVISCAKHPQNQPPMFVNQAKERARLEHEMLKYSNYGRMVYEPKPSMKQEPAQPDHKEVDE